MSKTMLKVNGAYIEDPMTMEWGLQDLDSEDGSGRNQSGTMLRDRKAKKRKLTCTYPPMDIDRMATLLQAVDDVFFTLEYLDAHDGTRRSGTFYVGDRTTPLLFKDRFTKKWMWNTLSMNFIEK